MLAASSAKNSETEQHLSCYLQTVLNSLNLLRVVLSSPQERGPGQGGTDTAGQDYSGGGQNQDFSGGDAGSGSQDYSSDQDFSSGDYGGGGSDDFSGGDFGGSDSTSC